MMTSPSNPLDVNLDEVSDEKYLERVNIKLLPSLPFQFQPIDEGRHILMLGFGAVLGKDHTEKDVVEAMYRLVIDMLKLSDVIQKKE